MEVGQDEDFTRDVSDQRKEWHEARATILGATDSPKILGLSKYGTALSVYNEKVHPDPTIREMSLPAWLGLRMQSTVGELYTTATGHRLRADNRLHRMPAHDFIGCHLDFRVRGQPKLLVECKTRAYMKGWGEEGSTNIPAEVWVQVQHEMMVTGAQQCDVAVLFGHHTFRIYEIARDDDFILGLLVKLLEFRTEHWEPGIPPLPTGHDMDTEYTKAQHPDHDDEIKAVTPEQAAVVETLRLARINAAQARLAEEGAKNRVRDIIGTAAGITGTFGTITLKRTKDTEDVAWQQVAASYRKALEEIWEEFDQYVTPTATHERPDLDAIQSLYTSVKPGYRRFHIDFEEEA